MHPNSTHRWGRRLAKRSILRLSAALVGCASIGSQAGDPPAVTHPSGFMKRGAPQRPAAVNTRPDFVLPLASGANGEIDPLMLEECEEEYEVQPATAASQQAQLLAVATPSLPARSIAQSGLPKPTSAQVEEWELAPSDKTVNAALARWAAKAGWQLLWEFPHDYEIDARSRVPGTFEEAVEAVARSIDTTEAPLLAIFYRGNKVLRIVAKGRE